ncbi:MAG: TetM/TetW/TetO/TetS family tetracycline resistance ribosomal protection protein [Eubacterium sp.]|nr:TetM/TetW/TetO/TetS family tetracycline resistance ribosomal protection protein [Eubacterium sp.]
MAAVDAGKTSLSEEILYVTGKIRVKGRVDKGDAFLDTYDLEKERGITIFSKQAVFDWKDWNFTLLDTPGHVDFSAETERTLQVLDYAILLVSGPDGVQGHTLTLWKLLEKHGIPTFLFVNKMDQAGTDKEEIFRGLKRDLGEGVVDFSQEKNSDFYEEVSYGSEEAMEEFLEEEKISQETMQGLVWERKIFPVFFGSALLGQGVEDLLEGISDLVLEPAYGEEFGARVFKITRDDKGNRLTHIKVTGGTLSARQEIFYPGSDNPEKVNQIRIYSGNRFETMDQVEAGCVCALTGLTETVAGQGLGCEGLGVAPVLEAVLTYAIVLPAEVDVSTMLPKLRILEEEEPELHIVWNEKKQEILAQVMGDVQIEILQKLIEDRFNIKVTFDQGSIVYKETIRGGVHGAGHFEPLRHYAEVHLWIEEGEPGSGIVIDSQCKEDVLDKNWQRLILTHIAERDHVGVLTGSSLTDVKITLIGGRAHLKHTEGGDFRQATYRAIRQGLMQAENVLLEPYYHYRLELPEESLGRAMTDLDQMKADFTLTQGQGGMSVLEGQGPVAAMRDYARQVVTYTRGRGRLVCMPDGYRPCKRQDQVVAELAYDPDRDLENPSNSVFCAHGSGFYVDWDQVADYMHCQVDFGQDQASENEDWEGSERTEEVWLGVEEIDDIIARASSANRKSGPISHKGISSRRGRSVKAKPVGLSKAPKKKEVREKFMLVDGYNIIFAWKDLAELAGDYIDGARGKLMDILCNYQGYKGFQLILVFDAYRVQNHKTEVIDYHNIKVVYTKEAETADQYIEKFAHQNGQKYDIIVATSDGLEQVIIRGAGCRLMSARDLEADVKRVEESLRNFQNQEEE